MNIEEVRIMCLSIHKDVEEGTPFENLGCNDVAFTIGGKIFAFLTLDTNMLVLKCDPEYAIELRSKYERTIQPAFHWNKKYWNQVHYGHAEITSQFMRSLIEHSMSEVVKKMTKKKRKELGFEI